MRRFSVNGRMVLVAVLALSLLGNALAIGAGLRLLRLRADLLGDQAYAGLQEPEVRRALNAALVAHRDTIAPALRAVLRARMAAMETGVQWGHGRSDGFETVSGARSMLYST